MRSGVLLEQESRAHDPAPEGLQMSFREIFGWGERCKNCGKRIGFWTLDQSLFSGHWFHSERCFEEWFRANHDGQEWVGMSYP